jgi:hypothetical protein
MNGTQNILSFKKTFIVLAMLATSLGFAKTLKYVCTENGLPLKELPSASSKDVDVLDYGTEVEILDEKGEYSKIRFYRFFEHILGYVLTSELSSEKIDKRMKIQFEDAVVYIEDIRLLSKNNTFEAEDTVSVKVSYGDSPFNKWVRVQPDKTVKVKVYQRVEKSLVVFDEQPFCDLSGSYTFKSEWKLMPPLLEDNMFSSLKDEVEDESFKEKISVAEIKDDLSRLCSQKVANMINPFKTLTENGIGIKSQNVWYKIVLIDENNKSTEKIIEFNLMVGC